MMAFPAHRCTGVSLHISHQNWLEVALLKDLWVNPGETSILQLDLLDPQFDPNSAWTRCIIAPFHRKNSGSFGWYHGITLSRICSIYCNRLAFIQKISRYIVKTWSKHSWNLQYSQNLVKTYQNILLMEEIRLTSVEGLSHYLRSGCTIPCVGDFWIINQYQLHPGKLT